MIIASAVTFEYRYQMCIKWTNFGSNMCMFIVPCLGKPYIKVCIPLVNQYFNFFNGVNKWSNH